MVYGPKVNIKREDFFGGDHEWWHSDTIVTNEYPFYVNGELKWRKVKRERDIPKACAICSASLVRPMDEIIDDTEFFSAYGLYAFGFEECVMPLNLCPDCAKKLLLRVAIQSL